MYCDSFEPYGLAMFFAKGDEEIALQKKLLEENVPHFLKHICPHIKSGKWICGDKITLADFCIGRLYTDYHCNPNAKCRDEFAKICADYPEWDAYGKKFMAENKAYLASRGPYPA